MEQHGGRRAVVIGGGLAGMLAASVLAEVAQVTVVERDVLPDSPVLRKGMPQAQHAHLLWSGGARAIEELLPGTLEKWVLHGARRIPLPTGLVSMSAQGWLRRFGEMQYLVACSRDLLDWVVRDTVLQDSAVTVLQRTELLGLQGTAARVTGVRVRSAEGAESTLEADFVVDASGRGSCAPQWLAALGVPAASEEEVDSGLAYATRIFRAPAGTEHYPVINVQSRPRDPKPGQTATIVPIEGGRWLVTLSGTRGGQPTRDADAFEPFARSVRHPVVGELISHAEPLTDVALSRSTVNRRRFYEKIDAWPDGFVVIGDAVATYNPVYGHGMSVAAQGVRSLRDALRRCDLAEPRLAHTVQTAVARPVAVAWDLAIGQDILYPGAIGKRPGKAANLLGRYVDRLMRTATARPLVTRALLDVMTLNAPLLTLASPAVLIAVLRGPRVRPLDGPPLSREEVKLVTGQAPAERHGRSDTVARS
ncbi:NAD(P)/FAD-dependent oxidoreductase [Streptomyces sp. NPDC021100]|uniref:NAD(P)/FAD-dependent oxidoreductase n=1 Tax=Streptomyces sp. NPDC021100 TaxID=3365114 RepID=UPI0037B2F1C9